MKNTLFPTKQYQQTIISATESLNRQQLAFFAIIVLDCFSQFIYYIKGISLPIQARDFYSYSDKTFSKAHFLNHKILFQFWKMSPAFINITNTGKLFTAEKCCIYLFIFMKNPITMEKRIPMTTMAFRKSIVKL